MKENSFTIGEYNNYCFGDVRFEIPRVLFSVIGDMKKYKTQILPSRTLISD